MKKFNIGDKVTVKKTGKQGVIVAKNKNDYAVRDSLIGFDNIISDAGKHEFYYADELKKCKLG